ncbi:caspase, EACC1-associated type [Amycolatopsis sp. VS8301801F10]|uniref:caspase, EACC1-associated type n=1 Tax=Amycolatopsis sp. VS8301801F10 TaxID=2652442 RepID=UPI0038FC2306
MHAFALRLQDLHRIARKPTQQSLARELRCSRPTVSAFLNGERFPSWQYVERFVLFCGGDLDEFDKLWRRTDELLETNRQPAADKGLRLPPAPSPITGFPRPEPAPGRRRSGRIAWGARPEPDHSQVILIGSGRHADPELGDLPATANNLAGLAAKLIGPDVGLRLDRLTAVGNPASVAEIGAAILEPASSATDLLLLYYCGHGLVDTRGELYLSVETTAVRHPEWSALPVSLLRRLLADSPARSRVLMLDCCFSGRAIDAMTGPSSVVHAQTEIEGGYTITSSSRTSGSVAFPGAPYTAFTGELLALLEEGVPDGSEYLSLGEIYRQLLSRMGQKGLPRPYQHGTGTVDRLALVRNRAWRLEEWQLAD